MSCRCPAKKSELLDAVVPKLSRVAVLVQPALPLHAAYAKGLQADAKSTGVKIFPVVASTAEHIEAAFDVIKRERVQALIVLADPSLFSKAVGIAQLALKNRVATLFPAPARLLIAFAASALAPHAAHAQPKLYRIGVLQAGTREDTTKLLRRAVLASGFLRSSVSSKAVTSLSKRVMPAASSSGCPRSLQKFSRPSRT